MHRYISRKMPLFRIIVCASPEITRIFDFDIRFKVCNFLNVLQIIAFGSTYSEMKPA